MTNNLRVGQYIDYLTTKKKIQLLLTKQFYLNQTHFLYKVIMIKMYFFIKSTLENKILV